MQADANAPGLGPLARALDLDVYEIIRPCPPCSLT